MLHKTPGIVLQTIKYSETSIICRIYTRELGLQSYMVKGVRTGKPSSKAPLFRPINILDLVVYRKDRKGLQHIKEYQLGHLYSSLPFDIIKSSIALFIIEVLSKVIKDEEPDADLYDFAEETLKELDALDKTDPNFHLYFLLRLSRFLGFLPSGEYDPPYEYFDLKEGSFVPGPATHGYQIGPPYSGYISVLLEENEPVEITNRERNTILDYLLQYYAFHLSDFGGMQSHKILHEVLGA
jgi:DNA repair protein RecO (recombination protein O)